MNTTNQKQPASARSSTRNERRKSVWQEAARRQLKAAMELKGYGYKNLANALGEGDAAEALITRVNRGTFSAAFFLQALRVMGIQSVDISHLPLQAPTAGKRDKSKSS